MRQKIVAILIGFIVMCFPQLSTRGYLCENREVESKQESACKMTDDEKFASWKGEQVILLPKHPISDDFLRYKEGRVGPVTVKDMAPVSYGKTGTIVEASKNGLIIVLDGTKEKIITKNELYLAFKSEVEAGKALIGKMLWNKGGFSMFGVNSDEFDNNQVKITPKPLTKLTVDRIGTGTLGDTITVYLKTEDGREGRIFVGGRGRCLDCRFHVYKSDSFKPCLSIWNGEGEFFTANPRTLHPEWSPEIWKSIENGEVSIGMTSEMVEAACGGGGGIPFRGIVYAENGSRAYILACGNREFLMEEGKVTKFVK